MRSYMQMIYIDSEDDARQTNMGAILPTNAETWAAFKSYKDLEVSKEKASFLLDYHKGNGELCATICLDVAGFEAITGEKAKSDAEYRQIDDEYWAEALSARIAQKH